MDDSECVLSLFYISRWRTSTSWDRQCPGPPHA